MLDIKRFIRACLVLPLPSFRPLFFLRRFHRLHRLVIPRLPADIHGRPLRIRIHKSREGERHLRVRVVNVLIRERRLHLHPVQRLGGWRAPERTELLHLHARGADGDRRDRGAAS